MDISEHDHVGDLLASAEVSLPADATFSVKAGAWSVEIIPDQGVGPAGLIGTNADTNSAMVKISAVPSGKQLIAGGGGSERGGLYISATNEIGEDGDRYITIQVYGAAEE